MPADLKDPEYWRYRSEEVLSIAESLEHAETKAVIRRERPDIPLRIHASIRRQLKEGAKDPVGMALAALKDVLVPDAH